MPQLRNETATTRTRKECLWAAMSAYPDKEPMITDVAVPLSKLPEMMQRSRGILDASPSKFPSPIVAHAGQIISVGQPRYFIYFKFFTRYYNVKQVMAILTFSYSSTRRVPLKSPKQSKSQLTWFHLSIPCPLALRHHSENIIAASTSIA